MPNRPKRPRDPFQLAYQVFQEASGEAPSTELPQETKSTAGRRRGGAKGGPARAKKLTAEQRSEIARIAAEARWKKADS